jgi:hypothetical protein
VHTLCSDQFYDSYNFVLLYLSLSVVFCCLSDCQNNISNAIIDDGFVVLPLLSISGRKCKKMAVHHTNIMEHNAASNNHTIIQSYNHTIIQSYNHTIIQLYNHTIIQSYNHTIIQSYNHNYTISWHSVLLVVTDSPITVQCGPIVSHTRRKWIQSCCSVFHRFMSKGESNQIDLV